MNYFVWHYKKAWGTLFLFWRNLILFPFYLFAVPLHLSTLFAPWHRQRVHMGRGFDLATFLNVLGFNVISRIIGAIVRSFTMCAGLFFMMCCFFLGMILALLWPFLIIFSLPFYFFVHRSCADIAQQSLSHHGKSLRQFILNLLSTDESLFALQRLTLDPANVIEEMKKASDINSFEQFLATLGGNASEVKLSDLLFASAFTFQPLKGYLAVHDLTPHEFLQTAQWYEKEFCSNDTAFFLSLSKIKSIPGIGSEWDYGYTVELDKYARDVTNTASPYPVLIGREKELERIQQTLLKTQGNNVLLIGEPGVARHQLVETFAHQIAIGNCNPRLMHKRILQLDAQALLSSRPSEREVKGFIEEMLEEAAYAGNVVLCIDNIDAYFQNESGKIDLTDVFEKFATSPIALIGITTPAHYHQYIEQNGALDTLFEKIEIAPVSTPILMEELELSIIPALEKKWGVYITFQTLKKTIEDADKYLTLTPFPGKAIELLDATCVFVSNKKNPKKVKTNGKLCSIVVPEDVDTVITQKTKIKVGTLQVDEKEKLLHLEEQMHRSVINQEIAISSIASSLRRARLDVSDRKKPIGSFLFLGPTGVGKTETAKALNGVYFGSESSLIRFDMSQFQLQEGMERLIGSSHLGTPGELTSALRDNPFCVLLLDEFEKADKQIYNLFLTLLDEGYINDSTGKKVDAKNCIVIATSNAGSEFIREQFQQGISGDALQKALVEYIQRERLFAPEFLNRFDNVVVFTPLSEGHMREVVRMQLDDLNKRLASKEVSIKITPELVNQLVATGYDPQFGARAIKRKIANTIEDQVARKIMDGSAKRGEEIAIELT